MMLLVASGELAVSVRIILPEPATPVLEKIADMRRGRFRAAAMCVRASGDADFTLALAVDSTLSREGFEIADAPDRSVRISAATDSA